MEDLNNMFEFITDWVAGMCSEHAFLLWFTWNDFFQLCVVTEIAK